MPELTHLRLDDETGTHIWVSCPVHIQPTRELLEQFTENHPERVVTESKTWGECQSCDILRA